MALGALLAAGCATISLRPTPVVFDDPLIRLGVVSAEPTEEEKSGVELRFIPPSDGLIKSREENTIYARVKDGKGIQLKFTMDRTDKFKAGSRGDSFVLSSETIIENSGGKLMEEEEITRRGEMVRFIQGFHHSKIGSFRITNWTRTPMFPQGPVKIGDPWSYNEMMEVRMDSPWVKEINPEPYRMRVVSRLEGFALVKGKRCAVVKTHTRQTKREHFKAFFKEILFDIHSDIEETSYLDYKAGTLVAKAVKTKSYTEGINVPVTDNGESQSLFYLL